MSAATLSIQEVNGFPVLVCQSENRREVYEVQNPMAPMQAEPALPSDSSLQDLGRLRVWVDGEWRDA